MSDILKLQFSIFSEWMLKKQVKPFSINFKLWNLNFVHPWQPTNQLYSTTCDSMRQLLKDEFKFSEHKIWMNETMHEGHHECFFI